MNDLDMAINARWQGFGGVVHTDHGVQFASWVFTQKISSVELLSSFGAVDDGRDSATMESFWSTMRIELLNRRSGKMCIEFANAILERIEVFYSLHRGYSLLAYATPYDYDLVRTQRALMATGSYWPRAEPRLKIWPACHLNGEQSLSRRVYFLRA